MRFRRSATLVVSFENKKIAILNFLTKDRFTCSAECLDFLATLDEWHTAEQLLNHFPDADRQTLADQIPQLVQFSALIVEGSSQADLDEKYRTEWQWGTVAGFYHFNVRDTPFVDGPGSREFMRKRKAWRPSPPLYQSNLNYPKRIDLPKTNLEREAFALMRRRRSQRRFLSQPIELQSLADCLFCGNGIVGFTDDEDFGHLPVTMTPSGGARNPFELYVYARNVTDLEPGFYHYAALEHDLGLVRAGEVRVPAMLGSQTWPAQAAAIIILVAHFPRSMWKYHLAPAYRVVLMEAGFISQNICLAATEHGLSAVPSGALKESLIEDYLGTPAIESSVIFTVSIGYADGN